MKTELFNILRILSPEEFKQLRLVVGSPLFHSNAKSEKLYTALLPKYPDFKLSPTDFRKVYKKVFPNKDFNANTLQKIFDVLLKTVEAYLLNLQLKKDGFLKESIMALTIEKRSDLFDLFQRTQQKLHKLLEEEKLRNADYWSRKENLYDQLYSNRQHNKRDTSNDTLNRLNKVIDLNFAHIKMYYGLLLQEPKNSDELPLRFEQDIKNAIKENAFKEDNLLELYCLYSEIDEPEKMARFKEIKEQLNEEERVFISKIDYERE